MKQMASAIMLRESAGTRSMNGSGPVSPRVVVRDRACAWRISTDSILLTRPVDSKMELIHSNQG